MYDSLRDEIERLHAEITITEQKLSTAGDEACKQRYSLLHGLLVTDQLLLKNKEEHLGATFQQGESALARVEAAAQQLAAQAHSDGPTAIRPQNLAA
jgi:hypothetical protein